MARKASTSTVSKAISAANERGGYWWQQTGETGQIVAGKVFRTLTAIRSHQKRITDKNLKHLRLYGNSEYRSLSADGYLQTPGTVGEERLRLNVIKSCCDTVAAKISKNKPRPMFMTDGGNHSQQQRAKRLTDFIGGVFHENKTYRVGRLCFLDGEVFGNGFVHVFWGPQDRIVHERVFPDELVVDDYECRWGPPRNLLWDRNVAKAKLLDAFPDPKDQEAIEAAGTETHSGSELGKGQIRVCEAWHLPDAESGKNGRHIICIKNHTLIDEEWKWDCFSFAKIAWSERLLGWHDEGLAEELTPVQFEINRNLIKIQEILNLHGMPAWWVPRSARFAKEQLDNDYGNAYTYDGAQAPTLVTPAPVPPEIYQHIDRLYQRAYEISGVSQAQAASKNPLGPDASGAALEQMNDIESERFILKGQQYEEFFLDISALTIKVATEMHKAGVDVEVSLPNRRAMQKIKWSEVALDQKDFVLKVFPASSLPSTPAGRVARIDDLVARGYISREDGMGLLDMPDIDSANNLNLAALHYFGYVLEKMLDDQVYIAPDPLMNLSYSLQKMTAAVLTARMEGAPEETLTLMETWIDETKALIQLMTPPAPAPAMPGQPPGPGMSPAGPQPLPPGMGGTEPPSGLLS